MNVLIATLSHLALAGPFLDYSGKMQEKYLCLEALAGYNPFKE